MCMINTVLQLPVKIQQEKKILRTMRPVKQIMTYQLNGIPGGYYTVDFRNNNDPVSHCEHC